MRSYASRMIYMYTPYGWYWVPRQMLEEAGVLEVEPEVEQYIGEYNDEEE